MPNFGSLGVACTLAAVGVLLIAVSFATDHWVNTSVDREGLMAEVTRGGPQATPINNSLRLDQAYFSRNRGLFRTCYKGTELSSGIFLDFIPEDDIVDGNCILERGYEIDGENQRVNNDADYDIRIQLMRVHIAFYILGMVMAIAAIVCGALGCWKYSTYSLRAAAVCCIAAFLFTAGGIAFFHGYEYLEKKKINHPMFPKYYLQQKVLDENTKMEYGYSYILGWLGACMVLIAGILNVCTAWSIRNEKHTQKEKSQPFNEPQPQFHVYAQPQYQPQSIVMAPQPQMVAAQPQQVVTPVPSVYGGYGPRPAPVGYVPAQSVYQGYGY